MDLVRLDIKCKCGGTLICDTSILLLSMPPKYSVTCEGCGIVNYVLVEDLNSMMKINDNIQKVIELKDGMFVQLREKLVIGTTYGEQIFTNAHIKDFSVRVYSVTHHGFFANSQKYGINIFYSNEMLDYKKTMLLNTSKETK